MKLTNKILIGAGIVAAIGFAALAANPPYVTKVATGTAATPAQVILPADQYGAQIRIVNVNWKSDTNNAALQFSGGAGAYTQTATNAATTTVTNKINSTNGLSASAVIVLQHLGTCYATTVSSFDMNPTNGNGTNVVLASGGWGVIASVGDSIYLMDTAVNVFTGATTNAQNGEAVYAASLPGRPVLIKLTPALVTNSFSVVARYD